MFVPSATPSKFMVVSARAVPATNRNNADSQIAYLANPRNISTSSVETQSFGLDTQLTRQLQWSCQANEEQGFIGGLRNLTGHHHKNARVVGPTNLVLTRI